MQQSNIYNFNAFTTDSINNSTETIIDSTSNISIFNNHLLESSSLQLIPIQHNSLETFIYWLIGLSTLLALTKLLFYKNFWLSLSANYSKRNFSLLQQLGTQIRHPINVIILLNFILSTSILVSVLSYNTYDFQNTTVNQYILDNIAFSSIIFFTIILISEIFKYIFRIDNFVQYYYARLLQFFNLISVISTIGLWILLFSNNQTITLFIFAILLISYLVKTYNILIFNSAKNKYNLFHYIIYICTVEILPLIIAIKLYFIEVL